MVQNANPSTLSNNTVELESINYEDNIIAGCCYENYKERITAAELLRLLRQYK